MRIVPEFMSFPRTRSFAYGFCLPIRATKLILKHRSLLLLSVLPIIITSLIYVYGIVSLQDTLRAVLNDWFLKWGLDPGSFWFTLAQITEWILLALIAAVTFSVSTAIVAAPFNDFLAEKTEPLTSPPLSRTQPKPWLQVAKVIWIDLWKSLAAGVAFLVSLLLILIPFLNLVGVIVGTLVVSFQYLNYPQSRRDIKLRGSLVFLWRYFYSSLGLGLSVSFLLSIPFVSILCLPVAVVSGTLLFARAQTQAPFRLR